MLIGKPENRKRGKDSRAIYRGRTRACQVKQRPINHVSLRKKKFRGGGFNNIAVQLNSNIIEATSPEKKIWRTLARAIVNDVLFTNFPKKHVRLFFYVNLDDSKEKM